MKSKISSGYLTPQAKTKKVQETSHSGNSGNSNLSALVEFNESSFQKLMSCPIKRKLVLKLIESEKDNIEAYKKRLKENERIEHNVSPLHKIHKNYKCESPTALMRRRALEQQNSSPLVGNTNNLTRPNSVNSNTSESSSSSSAQITFDQLLNGVVAFVEVKSKGQDRSNGVKALMVSMGAIVKDTFTKEVTHIVFKDGSYTTFQKAKLMNKHLVSVLWVEAIRTSGTKVSEKKFPALGTDAYELNVSKICSQMEREYNDVIKDELQKSLVTGIHNRSTKTLIDRRRTLMSPRMSTSSVCKSHTESVSSQDQEIEQIISRARINNRMTMDFINPSTDDPELTSDEDDDSRYDAVVNGDIITKKDRLTLPFKDLTNDNLSNMDITNIEQPIQPVLTPNMKKNLFNVERESLNTPCDFVNTSESSLVNLYDLQTPKIKQNQINDNSYIDKSILETQNDSLYRRRTKSLAKRVDNPVESPNSLSQAKTPINNPNCGIHILSKNRCNMSPVTPLIHSNILVQPAKTSIEKNNNSSDQEKSTVSDMSSLQLTSGNKNKNELVDQSKKSDNASSDMSSLKISNEKSSSNMSSLKVSLDKLSIEAISSEKPMRKSSSTELSVLQLSSENENSRSSNKSKPQTSRILTNLTNVTKEIFKRPSNVEKVLNDSYSSNNSFSPLLSKTINNIIKTLETPPSSDNITRRRKRRSLITCNENGETQTKVDSTQKITAESPTKKPKSIKSPQNKSSLSKSTPNGDLNAERPKRNRKSTAHLQNKNDQTDAPDKSNDPSKNRKRRTAATITNRESKSAEDKLDKDESLDKDTIEKSDVKLPTGKTRRIRKLYNPEDIVGIATTRVSKLSDDEERQFKRLQALEKTSSNDEQVIITGDVFLSKPFATSKESEQSTSNDDDILNGSDESEIQVPVKTRKKKKNNVEANVTVNGDRDEQRELAKEILGPTNVKTINGRKSNRMSQRCASKTDLNTSRSSRTSDDECLEKDKLRNKKMIISKSTGKITRRRQSQRLIKRNAKKPNFSSPENNIIPPTNRRSTMEFQTKAEMSARKKLKIDKLKRPSIVCTKLHKDSIMVFNQIVKKLGKFVIEDEVSNKTTHLVAGEPKRTINMLRAIAMGCWILKYEWVLKSLEVGRWLPEEDYEETDFSPAVQESRLHRDAFGPTYTMDIFKEYGQIYVARGSIPRSSDLKELITLCQGKITTILRNALIVVGGYVNDSRVTCVKETWVLDSITKYKKLPFKSYLIKSDNGVVL